MASNPSSEDECVQLLLKKLQAVAAASQRFTLPSRSHRRFLQAAGPVPPWIDDACLR
jgi:hypothetical protein